MTSRAYIKAKDYSNEPTKFGLYLATVSSANYDAIVTQLTNIQAAANGIVVGSFPGSQLNAVDVPVGAKNSLPEGQREVKWRVVYSDDVDPIGNGSFEVGMADMAQLDTNGQDLNTGPATPGEAFVNAIEANVKSRLGNSVTIESIKLVGRNI